MLDAKELKVVVSTLTQRHAWLKKSLNEGSADDAAKQEGIATLKLLESSIQKLAAASRQIPPKKPKPKPTPAVEKGPVPLDKARVLIADDDKDAIELLVGLLKDIGLKLVDEATDGIQAFDAIKRAETPYDIILCDWDMPELAGIDVHSKAQASNTLRGAHFIMVTGMSEAANIKKAVQQGIKDYVVKPVDGTILEEKILAALKLPPKGESTEAQDGEQ